MSSEYTPRKLRKFFPADDPTLKFRDRIKNFELEVIKDALEVANNNQSQAARLLQLERSFIVRLLKKIKATRETVIKI